MKYILFLLVTLAASDCFSQSANRIDSLDLFSGSWSGKNDSISLELKLFKKLHCYVAANDSGMVVAGWHKYMKNNTIVSSSFEAIDLRAADSTFTIFANYIYKHKLFFSFSDAIKRKRGTGTLEFLDGSTDKIKFILFNPEPVYFNLPGQTPYDLSFSIPTEFILCRIKE
jgi:hypothetical protein